MHTSIISQQQHKKHDVDCQLAVILNKDTKSEILKYEVKVQK